MKTKTIICIAVFVTAMVSGIACNDVYETDLDAPSSSTLPTEVAPRPSSSLISPPPPSIPVLCPEILLDSMTGEKDACELQSAVCEYGSSPDRQCNQVYACSAGTTPWRRYPSEPCAADQCPKNLPVAALSELPCGIDGGAESEELLCNMSDGVCACTTGRGGADVHDRRWVCTKPLSVCPIVRPRIGQVCAEGMLCDYGSCRSKRGIAMTCLAGVWAATSIDCDP